MLLSAAFLSAAAEAAGLDWTPPDGLRQVEVRGRAVPARTASAMAVRAGEAPFSEARSEGLGVRKGETVVLSYAAPGVRLSLRARALSPARVGETVRVLNLQSNREIDAIVTGPGAARALNPL
jgi:flagella basal body P-ring formation protein FlgA